MDRKQGTSYSVKETEERDLKDLKTQEQPHERKDFYWKNIFEKASRNSSYKRVYINLPGNSPGGGGI